MILPPGCVCDPCNQYFGSKLEKPVLDHAPFSVSRVSQAVRNKQGRQPLLEGYGLTLQSTGFWDRFLLASDPPHNHLMPLRGGRLVLNATWAKPEHIARFLLKMGLELLITSNDVDAYAGQFDPARNCARYGRLADKWDFAMGVYPDAEALVIDVRVDEIGPLETRQIFQYGAGVMESGDVIFSFMYGTFCFAVNLSRLPILEYILGFNARNTFALDSRWKLFPRKKRAIS